MAKSLLGLRTTIYKVPDLTKAKAWYTKAFGVKPYFDEPFYVGFSIGGYELGLLPDVVVGTPAIMCSRIGVLKISRIDMIIL